MTPSGDDEFWDRLKRQLSAAGRVTLTAPLLPNPDVPQGFTKSTVARFARFFVDACDGDAVRAIAYAKDFERLTEDKLFGRAVRVAVEKKLNA